MNGSRVAAGALEGGVIDPGSRLPRGRDLLILVLLVSLATGSLYLAATVVIAGELGFPLDDGWIHQVFARSLAETGQMAFNRGEPAAGSTSPLWTLLLAGARLLPLDPLLGAYALGLACLGACAWLTALLWQELDGGLPGPAAVVAALLVLMDWHLAWSALSGMETTLFVLLSLAIVLVTVRSGPPWLAGLLGGLLTAARPEGVALAGLCWIYSMWGLARPGRADAAGDRVMAAGLAARLAGAARYSLAFALCLAAPLVPVLLFSWSVSGTLLPNTFYAKSAYYGAGGFSVLGGFLVQAATILGHGPLGFVAPGLVVVPALLWRRRGPGVLLLGWALVLLALYAWRLPVTYHHARYEMPALPFLLLLAWWGICRFPGRQAFELLPRAYMLLLGVLLVVTWTEGAMVFGRDVRLINTVEVAAARWLRDNTEPTADVATHDIGAVGYLSGRRVVDTAGLVTPDAVPLIRDQQAMLAYLRRERVAYVAQFPVWYPQISAALADKEVFRIHDEGVLAAGGDDFVIYRTGW